MELTISKNGAIRIPAELRKKYHMTRGTKVTIVDYGGSLAIVPVIGKPVKQVRKLLKERVLDQKLKPHARS